VASASGPPENAQSAIHLANAIRDLARLAVGTTASDDVLARAAGSVEGLVATFRQHAQDSRYEQATRLSGEGTFVNHPMIGPANPCSPPIAMERDDGRLIGRVTFGTAQEGPPNCVYGGCIAAGFDAIVVMTAGINGLGGPTRSLSVRYRRPTPLNVPLRYEGRLGQREERWVVVEARLMAGDTVCAEATAEIAQASLPQ
jgi:hypothetical protein